MDTQTILHACSFLSKLLRNHILFSYWYWIEFYSWSVCIYWLKLRRISSSKPIHKTLRILFSVGLVMHLSDSTCCLTRILTSTFERELWLDWVLHHSLKLFWVRLLNPKSILWFLWSGHLAIMLSKNIETSGRRLWKLVQMSAPSFIRTHTAVMENMLMPEGGKKD